MADDLLVDNASGSHFDDILAAIKEHSKFKSSSRLWGNTPQKVEDYMKSRAEKLNDILYGEEGYVSFFNSLSPALQKEAKNQIGDIDNLSELYRKSPEALMGSINAFANNLENGSSFSNRISNIKYGIWDRHLATANSFLEPLSFRKRAINDILKGPQTGAKKQIQKTKGIQTVARILFGLTGLAGTVLSGGGLLAIFIGMGSAFLVSKAVDVRVFNPDLNEASQNKFEEIRDDFLEKNARFRLGTTEAVFQKTRNADLSFAVEGVEWFDLKANGTGRGVNLKTGSVRLPNEQHKKYYGMFDVNLTGKRLSIVPTKDFDSKHQESTEAVKNQALASAVQEIATSLGIKIDDNSNDNSNIGRVKIFSKGEPVGNSVGDNLLDNLQSIQTQRATAAAQQKAEHDAATFDTRFEKLLQSETFIKSAVSAALAGYITDPHAQNNGGEYQLGALKLLAKKDGDLAQFIEDKAKNGNIEYHRKINDAIDKYLQNNFGIDPNNKYPITDSSAAIAKHATEAMFGTGQSAEKDRVKAAIALTKGTPNASPTVLALMVNTGLRGADLKAIPHLQKAWSGTDASLSNDDRFKALSKAQQNLAKKVAAYAQLSGNDDAAKTAAAMLLIDEAMKLDANDLSPSDQTQPTSPVMSEEEQLVFEAYAGAGRNP